MEYSPFTAFMHFFKKARCRVIDSDELRDPKILGFPMFQGVHADIVSAVGDLFQLLIILPESDVSSR